MHMPVNDPFDMVYPIKDGIVYTLPDFNILNPAMDTRGFLNVHAEVLAHQPIRKFLEDKNAMAKLQREFYDRMAVGFEAMDNEDLAHGGMFWWKIRRHVAYDSRLMIKPKMLFIGAGNCRLARLFALRGFQVTATDISFNMLKVGKEHNDTLNIPMTYVAQNAELPFPFKSGYYDSVYSLCVMNHIVDWKNYLTEKLRCLKSRGVLLERLPNANLWSFWKLQETLYDGIEIKAKQCSPESVKMILNELNIHGRIWTHDRQVRINWLPQSAFHHKVPLNIPLGHLLYALRSRIEDNMLPARNGIYTMLRIVKT